MRVYLAIKYHPDQRNRPLIEALSAALAAQGLACDCVIRDLEQWGALRFSAPVLMQSSFALLDACDLLLAEVSEKGVGVGIEAGYAWARGKPILVAAPDGIEVSETLRGIASQVLAYQSVEDVAAAARALLAAKTDLQYN